MIGLAGFGHDFKSVSQSETGTLAQHTKDFLQHFFLYAMVPSVLKKIIPFGVIRNTRLALEGNTQIISDLIRERSENKDGSEKPKDILQLLIDNSDSNQEQEFHAFNKDELISNWYVTMRAWLTIMVALYSWLRASKLVPLLWPMPSTCWPKTLMFSKKHNKLLTKFAKDKYPCMIK